MNRRSFITKALAGSENEMVVWFDLADAIQHMINENGAAPRSIILITQEGVRQSEQKIVYR